MRFLLQPILNELKMKEVGFNANLAWAGKFF
jgi:hypothetical protein